MEKISDRFSKEQLVSDFKLVISDVEELLNATANQGGDKLAEIRARTEASLRLAKDEITDSQAMLIAKTKVVAKATERYVHENPWRLSGLAVGIGLVVGLLIGRR